MGSLESEITLFGELERQLSRLGLRDRVRDLSFLLTSEKVVVRGEVDSLEDRELVTQALNWRLLFLEPGFLTGVDSRLSVSRGAYPAARRALG